MKLVPNMVFIDKNLNSSKEDLTNINQTIRSIQKDIGKK